MFIENKYKRWYDAIVSNAQLRSTPLSYSEKHHIIPKSIGGQDSKNNLVHLSGREHFICHWLLIKITTGSNREKMIYALNGMRRVSRTHQQERYITKITSRVFANLKEEFSKIHSARLTGRTMSTEQKAKISAAGKGRIQSQETIDKRSASCTGKKRTLEQKERMRIAQLNRKEKTLEEKLVIATKISANRSGKGITAKSTEHKAKLSLANKGVSKGAMSEETKQKMRKPKSEETKQKMRKPKSEAHITAIQESKLRKKLAKLL
jgi:hypothetical protein